MEIDRLLFALHRWKMLVVVLVVLGAVGGLIAASSRDDVFEATASFTFATDQNIFGSSAVLDRALLNEVEELNSKPLRQAIAARTGLDTGSNIDHTMRARQVPDSDLIRLTVRSVDATLAAATANEWAREAVATANLRKTETLEVALNDASERKATALLVLQSTEDELQAILADLPLNRANPYAQLVGNGDLATRQQLARQELDTADALEASLEQELGNVLLSSLIDPASPPSIPTRDRGVGPVEGAGIGLGLALIAVAALSRSSSSPRSLEHITDTARPSDPHLTALSHEILSKASFDPLAIVSLSSADERSLHRVMTELGQTLGNLGYEVLIVSPDQLDNAEGSMTVPPDQLDDLFVIAHQDASAWQSSIILAPHDELRLRRNSLKKLSILSIVEVSHGANEAEAVRRIEASRCFDGEVLTLVS